MRVLMLLVTVCLLGCKYIVAPQPSARAYLPPDNWRELWARVEKCSGRTGYYERVFWFIPDSQMYSPEGKPQDGRWYPSTHNIYLDYRVVEVGGPFSQEYKDSRIMHEMLHDLLGTEHHPEEFVDCGLDG